MVVTVTDEGPGIANADLPNLFEPFFRSVDKESRRLNGESHGIGLNFSKRMAKSMGGDLVHNASHRPGCQFILTLELEHVANDHD